MLTILKVAGKLEPENEADYKVSRSSQLYSEHQTIYTLRVKRSHMSKVYNHEGKMHMAGKRHVAKTCFSIEAYKQITIASCNE